MTSCLWQSGLCRTNRKGPRWTSLTIHTTFLGGLQLIVSLCVGLYNHYLFTSRHRLHRVRKAGEQESMKANNSTVSWAKRGRALSGTTKKASFWSPGLKDFLTTCILRNRETLLKCGLQSAQKALLLSDCVTWANHSPLWTSASSSIKWKWQELGIITPGCILGIEPARQNTVNH